MKRDMMKLIEPYKANNERQSNEKNKEPLHNFIHILHHYGFGTAPNRLFLC